MEVVETTANWSYKSC